MPAFQVSRSIVIERHQDEVFDIAVDYNTWTSWSPWLGIDPQAIVSVEGDGVSVGSVYRWKGTVVGEGEIEHVHLKRPDEIDDEIRFIKPFASKSNVRFQFERVGSGTKVTWHMDGNLPWFMFWMQSQMEMYIGIDYEHGLKKLRDRVEKGKVHSRIEPVGVEQVPAMTVYGVRESCSMEEVGKAMSTVFARAKDALGREGIAAHGDMINVYHKADLKGRRFEFTGGYAVDDGVAVEPPGLRACKLPAGRALHLRHIGSHEHLGNAWSGAYQFARYKKFKLSKRESYEVYRNDPACTPESDRITDIYVPLR